MECISHLNEGSVPDLAVQCLDMWGQVHVQKEIILEEIQVTHIQIYTIKMIITSVRSQNARLFYQNYTVCSLSLTQRFLL